MNIDNFFETSEKEYFRNRDIHKYTKYEINLISNLTESDLKKEIIEEYPNAEAVIDYKIKETRSACLNNITGTIVTPK
jgi:hypothetical protein